MKNINIFYNKPDKYYEIAYEIEYIERLLEIRLTISIASKLLLTLSTHNVKMLS